MAKLLVHHLQRNGGMQAASSFIEEDGPSFNPYALRSPFDMQTSDGVSPLMLSCQMADYKLVEILVRAGANVLAVDSLGDSPVIYAARAAKRFKSIQSTDGAEQIYKVCPVVCYNLKFL